MENYRNWQNQVTDLSHAHEGGLFSKTKKSCHQICYLLICTSHEKKHCFPFR